jgi:hypothetical protein
MPNASEAVLLLIGQHDVAREEEPTKTKGRSMNQHDLENLSAWG